MQNRQEVRTKDVTFFSFLIPKKHVMFFTSLAARVLAFLTKLIYPNKKKKLN